MRSSKIIALSAAALIAVTGISCGKKNEKKIRVYSSLLCTTGADIAEDNEIQQIIADKIGAKFVETWLDEQDNEDKIISDMMISGEYPDFLHPSSTNIQKLISAGAYIPLDSYLDKYPNLKNYFTEAEWDRIRSEDGHIYYIPPFSKYYMQDTTTIHNDEAFWIQVQVLEWAGYPEINTLDEYFDLIERFIEANPTNADGEKYIGYEILANDSYFFGIDNPPMFLDGYPNDGCCIVDKETLTALDYNLSPTAEKWFKKLNEEYHKGIVDPDFSVLSPDEYNKKIESGLVLGMVDQYWNFNNHAKNLPEKCTYIPLGPTIEEGIEERYHSKKAFDASTGIGITVSCTDPEGALQFLNDILSPEILTLRFWGVEGVDYMVGEDGLFYQTDEQAKNWHDPDYSYKHVCTYGYLPFYWGMNQDGINAYDSQNQPSEFYKMQNDSVKRCFDAYGAETFVDLLNEAPDNDPWYPMWSYQNSLPEDSEAYKVSQEIEGAKHRYLPLLVMREDFDSAWKEYNTAYGKIDTDVFFGALTDEVRRLAAME